MTEGKKYAILDTDFVSKANLIQADAEDILANRVINFTGYEFYCHSMVVEELGRHGTMLAQAWLQEKISEQVIRLYSDKDIIDALTEKIGRKSFAVYLEFLKNSCEIYDKNYYESHYAALIELQKTDCTKEIFLQELQGCDDMIGAHQSLGEKKAYVLLQFLRYLHGEKVYMFCSDDFGARNGFASIGKIPCVSIIAVFYKLKSMGIGKEEADRYFRSFEEWCANHNQTQLHVWEWNGSYRRVRRNLRVVFEGLYNGEYVLMMNGDLAYKRVS